MKPEPISYEALLESIADGAEIDWETLDSSAASEKDRRRYRHLRLVARVAELHRTIAPDTHTEAPPPADDDAVPPPKVWGHLLIHERIGGGSFGDVYRARD